MTDFFALLQEPRRPWLELETLKAGFLKLSAAVHPDRAQGATAAEQQEATDQAAALNAAWRCLSEPKDRLRHLLELELGHAPAGLQQPPADALDLFVSVGRLCRETDQFLAERSKTTSPMRKAQLFQRGLEWTDELMNIQAVLREKQEQLAAELRTLNPAWVEASQVGHPERLTRLPLARLEELYRRSSYLSRWSGQIQDRVVQLSL